MTIDQLIQKLDRLSNVQKIIFFVGIICLTIFVYWFFFFNPQYKKIEPLGKDIRQLKQRLDTYRKKVVNLPELEKKYQSLQDEFAYAETLLPETSQGVERLLSSIEKLGNQLGIEFLLFVPGDERQHQFYATRSVNLRIQGPFHNLMHFFSKMSRLDRLVSLERIQLHPRKIKNQGQVIEASTKIAVYRSLTSEELQNKKGKNQ